MKVTLVSIAVSSVITSVTFAEMKPLQQSSSVTLSSLTQQVYERHPAHHNELAQQQQINANNDLADATFAGVKRISLNHQNDVLGSSDGLQEWESTVKMPLWLPGQQKQQRSLSVSLSAQLPAYKQQIRLAASAKVRELVWDVMLTNTATKQAYQVWQSALRLEQDVTARVKAGELAGAERLLATTNVLEMKNQYLLNKSELDFSLSTYRAITQQQLLPEMYQEILSDNFVIDHHHPLLMMMEQHINTLRAKKNLANFDSTVNTSLSVGVRRERQLYGESFNNSLGLAISFALDNEVYRQPAIADAAKELADAEITRQQLERTLNVTLFSRLHDLETKRLQMGLLNQQNDTTQQYLILQQRAFALGDLDLVSLLRSQSLANETINHKLALEVDIKYTIALINQALGVIL